MDLCSQTLLLWGRFLHHQHFRRSGCETQQQIDLEIESVPDPNPPIMEIISASIDSNGSLIATAELITDGGFHSGSWIRYPVHPMISWTVPDRPSGSTPINLLLISLLPFPPPTTRFISAPTPVI